jgi:putative ABC transport system permease protein
VVLAGIMAAGSFTAVSVIASRAAVRVRPAPLDR